MKLFGILIGIILANFGFSTTFEEYCNNKEDESIIEFLRKSKYRFSSSTMVI